MSDPIKVIIRHLQRRCAPHATASIRHSESREWRSLLFDGARHRIALTISGEGAEGAIEALRQTIDAADFAICGHLVADVRLADIDHRDGDAVVTVEAMTIEA